MSVTLPGSDVIKTFIIFLFIGVPLIVFMTDYLRIQPGLAVAAAFILSIFISMWLGCLTPHSKRGTRGTRASNPIWPKTVETVTATINEKTFSTLSKISSVFMSKSGP